MKKLLMLLECLVVICLLAGCNFGNKESAGTFTVTEYEVFATENQQTWAKSHNCSKNADGKYVFYKYYLKSATNSAYSNYINKDIFYKTGATSVANMFPTKCKNNVEKMLNDGNFEIMDNQSWLGYNTILLNAYPE